MADSQSFRQTLASGQLVWGPFLVSPDPLAAEAMARIDCDAVCIDMEHGPFSRMDASTCIAAVQRAGHAAIVRVAENRPQLIGDAFDRGADAVLCPHVSDAAAAQALAAAARYSGHRGFSGATRAAGYGATGMDALIGREDGRVAVIAQIEDAEAVENADAICAVDGIDCIFIGRSDLTVSMGLTDRNDPRVTDAVAHVASLATKAGKSVGTFTTDLDEIPHWRSQGINLFLLGSSLGFMVAGGNAMARRLRGEG